MPVLISSLAFTLLSACTREAPLIPDNVLFPWVSMDGLVFPGNVTCMQVAGDGTVYLGYYSYESGPAMAGVLVSDDRGESWVDHEIGTGRVICLSIGAEGELYASGDDGIVYRSTDGGAGWEKIELYPGSYDYIYSTIGPGGEVLLWGARSSIFLSTDAGASWEAVSDTVPGGWLDKLAFDEGARVCALSDNGLFFSDDSCRSWTFQDNAWNPSDIRRLTTDADGDFLLLAEGDIFTSPDRGETWELLHDEEEYYIHAVWADGRGRLFFGTDSHDHHGLFLSEDSGSSWRSIGDLSDQYRRTILCSGPQGEIYLSTGKNGTGFCRSIDDGASWERLGLPENDPLTILPVSGGNVYVSLNGSGIFRTTNGSGGWECFEGDRDFLRAHILSEDERGELVASNGWDIFSTGLAEADWKPFSELRLSNVLTVEFSPWSDVYCGCSYAGVFSIPAAGGTWLNIGMRHYFITSIVAAGPEALYASCRFGGVFRYTGEADLWDQVNEGFEDLYITRMVEGPAGTILAGSMLSGVYILDSENERWRRIGDGDISVIDILTYEDTAIIVTERSGLFYYRLEAGGLMSLYDYLNGELAERIDRDEIGGAAIGPDGHIYLLIGPDILKSRYSAGDIDSFLR